MKNDIRALVLDIDGVLTDGTVMVDGSGGKRIFLRDLDALTRAREREIRIAFLSGEKQSEAEPVVRRCGGGIVVYDAKNKEEGMHQLAIKLGVELSEICYVGDARRDVKALKLVGLGLTPADGDKVAKSAATRVLMASGGRGAVSEAVDIILESAETDSDQDSE